MNLKQMKIFWLLSLHKRRGKQLNSVFHLKGVRHRLANTSGRNAVDEHTSNLIVKSVKQMNKMRNPGFI